MNNTKTIEQIDHTVAELRDLKVWFELGSMNQALICDCITILLDKKCDLI